MKNALLITAVLGLMPSLLYAQTGSALDKELDSELNQASQPKVVEAAPAVAVAPTKTVVVPSQAPQAAPPVQAEAAIATKGDVSGQPIYIVNQATPTAAAQTQAQQTAVQKQPQVDIQAAPLTKSRAEQIREARQQAEVETENKLVEKLESSRIEDEKKRAQALFGDAFDKSKEQQAQPVVVQQQQQQAVVAPVAPVAAAPVVSDDQRKQEVRDQVRAELDAEKKSVAADEPSIEKHLIGLNIGMGDYPDAQNVRGNYVLGATYGVRIDQAEIEGGFTYGSYTVDQPGGGTYNPYYGYVPNLVDVKQYAGSLAGKYLLLGGKIHPLVGAVAQYSYRTYSWQNSNVYASNSSDATSQGFDLGAIAGVDIDMNRKMSVGFDFRYMWNVASQKNINNNYWMTSGQYPGTVDLQKLQYYTMAINVKAAF